MAQFEENASNHSSWADLFAKKKEELHQKLIQLIKDYNQALRDELPEAQSLGQQMVRQRTKNERFDELAREFMQNYVHDLS